MSLEPKLVGEYDYLHFVSLPTSLSRDNWLKPTEISLKIGSFAFKMYQIITKQDFYQPILWIGGTNLWSSVSILRDDCNKV